MSWRKHESHREETKAVKEALTKAGINAMVGHGKGTAWGWLEINIGANPSGIEHWKERDGKTNRLCRRECPACEINRHLRKRVRKIAQEVTGRNGDYDGEIIILSQDHWDRKLNKSVPILQKGDKCHVDTR